MQINIKILKALKNSGFTAKEAADGIRKVWEGLPTARELANNFYRNLKWWRDK